MKSPAFKLISLFNYYIFKLHFFFPLDGKGEGRIKVFNQLFEHRIFWTGILGYRENIRPQGIYSLLFPQGIYSLDWKTDPIPKASPSPLPFPSFLFIFILKAHNTTTPQPPCIGKGQLKVISGPLKLWPLPALQHQLFSRIIDLVNFFQFPLLYFVFPPGLHLCNSLCLKHSSLRFIWLTHAHPSSLPLDVISREKPFLLLKSTLSVLSMCICSIWFLIDFTVNTRS